jgi:hypothetical protein
VPFLQDGVFKHTLARRKEVGEGWALGKVVGKEKMGEVLVGRSLRLGIFLCCFLWLSYQR